MLIRLKETELLKAQRHEARAPAGGITHYQTSQEFKGGQFIPKDLLEHEKQAAVDAMPDLISEFSSDLQLLRGIYEQNAGLIQSGITAYGPQKKPLVPLSTIEARMKAAVRNTYSRAFILGKRASGDLTGATEREIKILQTLRLDEYRYLRGFLSDMKTGSGVMDYQHRMEMYANAARESFWLGWVSAKKSGAITWRLGPTEHCEDCLKFSEHGPYSVQDFIDQVLPMVPQSGALTCKGFHCLCSLSDGSNAVPSWLS